MATLKTCSKCKNSKSIDDFHKNSSSPDSLQAYCKVCAKSYSENNVEKISSYQKEYRGNNKDKAVAYNKNYRQINEKEIKNKKKQYREDNKEAIASKKLEYEKNRLHSDPTFKIRKKLSLGIRIALKGNKSNFSILQFLPYSMADLKDHLEKQFEPWMTWDNWGSYDPKIWNDNSAQTWTWQLDHIIPQCMLPYQSMTDENFKKCWALENLRPLSAKQNVIEGSKTRSTK